MNATLTLPAPAKLNLMLHITGRRADGYHQLQTLFQLLDWGDSLQFRPNRSGNITLECRGLSIPNDENIVLKAARLLQRGDRGVDIFLEKRIPAGGGLGGGSSDAATTLLALNHLWALHLPLSELQSLSSGLGADVPVFVAGSSAWAEGTGEILTPVQLPQRWFLIVVPDCKVSTAEIFSHRQLTRNTSPIKMAAFFNGDSRNDCQPLVRRLHAEVDNALKWLENFGDARLTGTGGCAFVQFDSEAEAVSARRQLPDGWNAVTAGGINQSPVHAALV